GDIQLPAGYNVATLCRNLEPHTDSLPNASRFDPSRWRDPATLAHLQRRGVHVPFGSGPRMCPGRSLALLEIQVALALLLRNFEFERVGERDAVREHLAFTMSPSGLRVILRPRDSLRNGI